jgi:hypothetical protein
MSIIVHEGGVLTIARLRLHHASTRFGTERGNTFWSDLQGHGHDILCQLPQLICRLRRNQQPVDMLDDAVAMMILAQELYRCLVTDAKSTVLHNVRVRRIAQHPGSLISSYTMRC